MVARCRVKGLDARVADAMHLGLPDASVDAVYTMNCLLHVPNRDLSAVLAEVARVLRPGGLFFLGVYGGHDDEGIADRDVHDPPRFFCFRTDERLCAAAAEVLEILDFHVIGDGDRRFQSLTLARPSEAA